jgi:hypothetical protein
MKCFAYAALGSLLVFPGIPDVFASQASTPAQAKPAIEALKLPAGTAFLAKLSTDLSASQCKPGDPLEAEVTQDIKQGHDVLLKKGSALLGHVAEVNVSTSDTPHLIVAIAFDSVRMKDGKGFSLNLVIQALAPEADMDSNGSLTDFTGTGMTNATRIAGVKGHSSTVNGSINHLTPTSTGVYDLQGLALEDQTANGARFSTLAFSKGHFRLKKGAQLVMKVVSR